MKKTTQPAASHPLRHTRTEAKSDPFKGIQFSVPAGEEKLRHVHRARAAVPDSGLVAFRVNNAFTFYHGDAGGAAALANLTLFKFGKVDAAEFPLGDVERVARALHEAGKTLYLADPATAYPVAYELPPPPEVQSAIRARYEAIVSEMRHVRGECVALWTMKDGKLALHKGRKVSGCQVGAFLVHAEPPGYAVTLSALGQRIGTVPLPTMADAKLLALLAGWSHSWDFEGKTIPENEVEHLTALLKHWRANRWDSIAKLCTLSSEPLVNEDPETTADRKTLTEAFDEAAGLAAEPVHVDAKPTQPTVSADAVKLFNHLKGGKCDFKTLSAVMDFDHVKTVDALRELRDAKLVRHVEQSASGPPSQNFGPGDSFENLA